MNKRLSVPAVLLLALTLCLSLFPALPASAEETEPETVHIRTADDLMALAVNCSLDTWSDGKKIVLDNDLSLTEVDFDSIPIFNGEFDGGGHTIYDLNISSAQSPSGFFLETGKDANIHDLNISGSVFTEGDDSMVGGVVGRNRGMLTNCGFSGDVSARSQVGGVVGKNEATGLLTACTASGSVRGLSQTGGVCGENAGALSGCENRCFVNTESVDPSLRFDAIDTSSILNFIRSIRSDNAGITTDTGGVCGKSTGFIEGCANTGTVGYLHLGYNVGGVTGHSSGFVSGCSNHGEVYGRKDVGGVVGQAEPLVETEQAENLLAGVGYRLYALNQSLNDAIVDARSVSDDLSARFQTIAWYLSPVADAVQDIDVLDPESAWYLQSIISDAVYNVTNEMAAIGDSVRQQSGILLDDMDRINQNATALSGAAIQAASALTGLSGTGDEEILVDASGTVDEDQLTFGKVAGSSNDGSVYGDSNVGGVAGNLSVEDSTNPENELGIRGSGLARDQINLNAVITGCVNRGEVTAKRECAGGVVGKMDFGLASHCAAYGTITLEDGDYAGGIAGLCYGTVKNCCAKCSIGGKRYIGGVVGNGGDVRRGGERTSSVSGCYTLAEIRDTPQFAGAISGGGAGKYENNFFVPMGFAGLDRLSIHGQAEPVSFEEFAAVEGLPEECKTFSLRFVVDGAVVKQLGFDYGASFDRSVYPEVEHRDGAYAVWDRGELNDLRFDTTVTAEYRVDETVLRSEEKREDGRSAVYVDGQFQQGDALTLTMIPVGEDDIRAFSSDWKDTVREQLRSIFRDRDPDYSIPVSVAERLRVAFPEDGLETHTIRYLTPDGQTGNYRLYLADEDGWQRIRPTTFGSYFMFEAPGDEAEFCLVATIQSWWIVAYIAAGLLVLLLLIVAIRKLAKLLKSRPKKQRPPRSERPVPRFLKAHRKAILILTPILILAAAGALVTLRFGSVGSAFSAYRVIKDFSRRESDMQTEISINMNDRELKMNTTVHRVVKDGRVIRCTEQYGVPIYISDGMVCLENGRVFRLSGGQLGQGKALDLALDVFLHEEVEKTVDGDSVRYEAVIGGETADRILQLFVPAGGEELLRAESMTVTMDALGGELQRLAFSGSGSATGGKDFSFNVSLTPQTMDERPVIPQAVLDAIADGGREDALLLSEGLLRLLAAWIKNESAETVSADISVNADCGALNLNPRYRYSRRNVDGTDIHCIKSALFTLYFTDDAACTASGADLSEAQQRVRDAARLIPIARELCLEGQFDCTTAGERSVYTVTLSNESAADIVSRVLPELDRMNVSYSDCSLRITVVSGVLDSIELDCGGSLRIVSRDVNASVRAAVSFNGNDAERIPVKVRKTLLG